MASQTPIDADEILPPLPDIDADEPDAAEQRERAAERAHAEDVLETLATLAENGVEDRERRVRFGKRMASLCYFGGLTPSRAKAKTAREIFSGQTLEETAALLGITKGGLSKLLGQAASSVVEGRRLAYERYVDIPMRFLAERTFDAENAPDGEHHVVILEAIDPRPERGIYGAHGPDTAPPDPQYAVITETWFPDPVSSFSGSEIEAYLTGEDLVEELYEGRRFEDLDVASAYFEFLDRCGFDVDTAPFDRLSAYAQDKLLDEL